MAIRLGDTAPDFTGGTISFHQWLGDSWGILFSHPKDYTLVCTTELGQVAKLQPEFKARNCKTIGLSVDPLKDHEGWSGDILETQGVALNFPLIVEAGVPVGWRALQVADVAALIDMMDIGVVTAARAASFDLVRPLVESDHGYHADGRRNNRREAVNALREEWEDVAQLRYRPEGIAEAERDLKLHKRVLETIREHGSEAGVPVLMLALESDRKQMRALAIKLLKALTGTDRGFSAEGPADARRDSLRRWNQWWEKLTVEGAR